MRRLGARAFGSLVFSAVAVSAQAAPVDSPMHIDVVDCTEIFASRFPSILKLEIDVLLRERGQTRSPERIAVRCEAEKAHIGVTLGAASRTSTIDLQRLTVEHRARAVALAAAELVHAMDAPGAPQPQAPREPAPPIAPPTADRAISDSSRPTSRGPALMVGGLLQWLGDPAAVLLGGRAAFLYPLGEVVTPEISFDASFGEVASRAARIAIRNLSAGAHLYFGTTTGRLRWDMGPGARFGSMRLAGEPDTGSTLVGDTVTAAWGGPELRARVAYRPSQLQPASFALQIGAGIVALPVRGLLDGSESIYAVDGAWMSVGAEIGLGL
jgi:hypothetical protein